MQEIDSLILKLETPIAKIREIITLKPNRNFRIEKFWMDFTPSQWSIYEYHFKSGDIVQYLVRNLHITRDGMVTSTDSDYMVYDYNCIQGNLDMKHHKAIHDYAICSLHKRYTPYAFHHSDKELCVAYNEFYGCYKVGKTISSMPSHDDLPLHLVQWESGYTSFVKDKYYNSTEEDIVETETEV